ncbi:hypothetical protein GIB67_010730 [Kingdonia uniflora]|uniref:Apple domain-containing protein n=1 Tax=Kingdonia uniflora TaxID=39325 RepID=A0A7J7L8W9_9MAGN|nr:hypothetical protein GIB67_010730 [Kingdonia uniflora]
MKLEEKHEAGSMELSNPTPGSLGMVCNAGKQRTKGYENAGCRQSDRGRIRNVHAMANISTRFLSQQHNKQPESNTGCKPQWGQSILVSKAEPKPDANSTKSGPTSIQPHDFFTHNSYGGPYGNIYQGYFSYSDYYEALESWRREKLEEAKQLKLGKAELNSSISSQESKMLENALESNWVALLEDIGVWLPAEIINNEHNDKSEGEEELEEQIIPGRPIPPECNAELHTDYGGVAVRWGLTHHKESAADCCQACLDHAKYAKPGQRKCNIWVYCPSESGCHSPDIYEHKLQECWLKHADKPVKNFKDKYSESYRNAHPTAPSVVPWLSGVIGS